jgi:hypothetical protein
MRPNQKQRMRGRNNGRRGPNPLTRTYESNGPDMKVRGTAAHVAEKYVQLARDAHSSGDPVMAESYLQHAEHYYRLIAAAQAAQAAQQQAQITGVPLVESDEDDDDFDGGTSDRFTFRSPQSFNEQANGGPNGNGGYPNGEPRPEGEPRQNGNRQDGHRQDGRPPREYRNDGRDPRPPRDFGDRGERQDRGDRPDRGDRDNRGERYERRDRNDFRRNNRDNYGNGEQPSYQPDQTAEGEAGPQPDVNEGADQRPPRDFNDRNGGRNRFRDRRERRGGDRFGPREGGDRYGEGRDGAPEASDEPVGLPSFITQPVAATPEPEPVAAASEEAPAPRRRAPRRKPRDEAGAEDAGE